MPTKKYRRVNLFFSRTEPPMCSRCVIIIALLSQTWTLLKPRELICAALRSGHENVEGRILKRTVLIRFYIAISSHDFIVRGWRRLIWGRKWRWWWRWYQDSDVIRRRRVLPYRRRRHCCCRSIDNAVANVGCICQGDNVILLHTSVMLWSTAMVIMTFTVVFAEDRV